MHGDGKLDFEDVKEKYEQMMDWLARLYVNTLNLIHYMHDKYSYEALEMALHDTCVRRFFATGVAGLSCAADSLSAIKYAEVTPIYGENGLIEDFDIKGDFPKYGNDDDRVDSIAVEVLTKFSNELKKNPTYRESEHTLSALTITSNVVYGKKTGTTPDGERKANRLRPARIPCTTEKYAERWRRSTPYPNFLTVAVRTVYPIPSRFCQTRSAIARKREWTIFPICSTDILKTADTI